MFTDERHFSLSPQAGEIRQAQKCLNNYESYYNLCIRETQPRKVTLHGAQKCLIPNSRHLI